MKRIGCMSSDCFRIYEKDNGKSIYEHGYKKYTGYLYPLWYHDSGYLVEYRVSICGCEKGRGYYMEQYKATADEFIEMFLGDVEPECRAELIKDFEAINYKRWDDKPKYFTPEYLEWKSIGRFGLVRDAKVVGIPKGRTWRVHLGNLKSVVRII